MNMNMLQNGCMSVCVYKIHRYLLVKNNKVGHVALTHRLLAHSTLVSVPGGLVMMGIRNQPGTNPQQGERLNLQMSGVPETHH